jgi:L-iditol 2-dehydrogenase
MRAVMIDSPGRLKVVEMPKPKPGEGEVLVKLRCCGICGTDIEKVQGEGITTKVLGHETVGELAELGAGVDELKVGERVFTHHHVPDLTCELCEKGEYTYCQEYMKHNLVPCGLADYYIVPSFNVQRGAVLRLPDSLGYEEASFIEPLACCIRGLDQADARNAGSALIFGAGPVGLMHLKLLRSFGVEKLGVADVSEYRLSLAGGMGADFTFDPASDREKQEEALKQFERGPDLVVVATASMAALEEALRLVGRSGTVLLFGAPRKGATATIDTAHLFLNGTRLITSYAAYETETAEAMRLLAEKKVHVSDMITHRFPLERSGEAFAVASEHRCMKALILD